MDCGAITFRWNKAYAIFNINYRLATGISNYFPTQENDVKAAIEFIYGKQKKLRKS